MLKMCFYWSLVLFIHPSINLLPLSCPAKAVSEEKLRPSSPQAAESYNLSRVSWICLRASSWVDMFKIPLLGCLQKAFDSNTSTTILISLAPLKLESHPALQPIKNIFHSINTGYHYWDKRNLRQTKPHHQYLGLLKLPVTWKGCIWLHWLMLISKR